jgi:uncharacterized phage-associated protein
MEATYKKIAQVQNYLARKEGGKIDKLKLVKLIYLADRYHIRKYGRLVTGDYYFAMQYGPVGSVTKDIAGFSEYLAPEELEYAQKYLAPLGGDTNTIISVNEVDGDELSETDVEALDFAYQTFGSRDSVDLVELTHEYPEWSKRKGQLDLGASRVLIDNVDFFENPANFRDDKFALDSDFLAESKEIYERRAAVNKKLAA